MSEAKTILVTGANGKVGRRITGRFIADGHTVIATSRRAEALAELAALFKSGPGRIEGIVADLTGGGGIGLAHELASRNFRPDVIVNNAIDLSNQKLPDSGRPNADQWHREFDLAVIAPYELTTAIAEQSGSRLRSVVNISSMYGVVPRNPGLYEDPLHESPIHYGVAKAAMLHLNKELAVRLAPRGIRVNAVSFGGIEGRVGPAFKERYARLAPSARMLTEDEIAGSVAFLISDDASSIVGHNLIVDGGWSVW